MNSNKPPPTNSDRGALLRWELAAVGLVMLVLVAVALLPERQAEMGPGRLVVYGSLILLGALLVAFWVWGGRTLARRLQTAETGLQELQERMSAIFRLSHRFAHATDETAVIELVLQMCVDVVQVQGASFIPLDDRSLPLPAIVKGVFSMSGPEDWAEHLASARVRDQCAACQIHQANLQDPCPILHEVVTPEVEGIFCFPLRRGEREFGLLNLYLQENQALDPEALAFLSAMMDEMGVAIEAIRLRDRARATTQSLGSIRKFDRDELLNSLVENLNNAIRGSYAYLWVSQDELSSRASEWTIGDPPIEVQKFMESLASAARGRDVPVDQESQIPKKLPPEGVAAFLVCPLTLPDQSRVGNLVLVKSSGEAFSESSVEIAKSIASQIALTAQYTRRVQTLEYHAVMEERARLAREIHDGMAQTLGYLKLLTAQLQSNLARGETTRIEQLMEISRLTLAEAYVDTRQAIDGLRITPENGFGSWIYQAVEDFSSNIRMDVKVETDPFPATVQPEVQAQLIRIVQEALTNIRKHAGANRVWIRGGMWHGDLVLEIQDNGIGFEPEDVMHLTRHGLRGMQERADLIEAEFQIISVPGDGTTVRVRLPGSVMERSS